MPAMAGPEVGEDVAEEVRAHDHVEPVRVLHEVRGEDVDVVLVGLDVGILRLAMAAKRSSQYGMVMDDAVRLGGRGDVLLRPLARASSKA